MKILLFAIAVVAIIGAVIYFRSRPKTITGAQFAQILHDAMPRTKVPKIGSFYYNNGSWWQENPTLTTPDKKPITVLFHSRDSDSLAPPSEGQLALINAISERLPSIWPALQNEFEAYFKEMDDPALWKNSTEWELSVDGDMQPSGWSISFKVPDGHAAWYYKDFENFEGSSAHATY
jgi:hypothetical protein